MTRIRKAFTLIELLVVIAIIAILAAILFPVFAQAKQAAKVTVSISNMKQIGTSWWMYQSDNDDMFSPRRTFVGPPIGPGWLSWKQLLMPYIKNDNIFTDSVNPAAKYLDDTSDPDYNLSQGDKVLGDRLARGYSYYDQSWFVNQNWSSLAYSPGQLENVSNTIAICEQKRIWVDTGPWLNWNKAESDPITGTVGALGWPWGGKKWDDKAMVVVYVDGHAKRAGTGAICGKDDELNQWNYVRNRLHSGYGLGDLTWVDTYCVTRPAEVR